MLNHLKYTAGMVLYPMQSGLKQQAAHFCQNDAKIRLRERHSFAFIRMHAQLNSHAHGARRTK